MVKRYLIMADWRRQIQLFLTMPDIGYLVNVMIVYGMICLKFEKSSQIKDTRSYRVTS